MKPELSCKKRSLLLTLALFLACPVFWGCAKESDLSLSTAHYKTSPWRPAIEKATEEMASSGLFFKEERAEFDEDQGQAFVLSHPFLTYSRQIQTLHSFLLSVEIAQDNVDLSVPRLVLERKETAQVKHHELCAERSRRSGINHGPISGHERTILFTDRAKAILEAQAQNAQDGLKIIVLPLGKVQLHGIAPRESVEKWRRLLKAFLEDYEHELISPLLRNTYELLSRINTR